VARKYRPLGVAFVGLTDETERDLPAIKKFIDETPGFDWPVGYGAAPVMTELNIPGIPTLIVFGPDGRAHWSWLGEGPRGLESKLDELLAAQPAPAIDRQDATAEIVKLLDGLAVGTPAEYDRIPEIWEHAIAAGKRNDATEVHRLLDLSMPKEDEPLADWQAVVLGGGVINGISQKGLWPKRRLAELVADQPELQARWNRTVELASAMADNEAVKTGTRYDGLRILGADDYQKWGPQLVRYLAAGVDDELHMGAVSGLSDMESTEVAAALIEAFPRLNEENRKLAFDALLRTPEREAALQTAVKDGKVSEEQLTAEQVGKLSKAKP
jgi:hypothetical protein